MSDDNAIMGFIPKNDYVRYAYYLLLGASALGLLLSLFALMGIGMPFQGLVTIANVLGLVMALLGYFVFKSEFSTLDQSHLLYLSVLIGIFFIVGIILGSIIMTAVFVGLALVLLVSFAQLLLLWTGYNSWSHGRSVTKENIQSEIQLALKRG